ncbi:hypothetical protein Fmac_015600 [Flemingia macrophylla]|uniref:Uncharacterized protein n=1 Tax=Flemingia macrophylla TaxID=520843 RepID=A0ABD1MF41_9FABA
MKMEMIALVLVIALSTKALAGPAPEQVVDTSGKKVRAGGNYYIVPATPDVGGLSLSTTGEDCPLDVVAVDGYQGLPLTLVPVNDKKGVIRVSTDLNLYFSTETRCPQSTVWKLKDYDYSTGQWFVTTGGVLGNAGWQTINNWFKVEKYEDAYKLVYCPSVCKYCSYQCSDVGIYQDQYGKRLALTSQPYKRRKSLQEHVEAVELHLWRSPSIVGEFREKENMKILFLWYMHIGEWDKPVPYAVFAYNEILFTQKESRRSTLFVSAEMDVIASEEKQENGFGASSYIVKDLRGKPSWQSRKTRIPFHACMQRIKEKDVVTEG